MAKFEDDIAALQADNVAIKADFVTIAGGIGTLNQTITDLKNATTNPTPEQQAALDAAVQQANDLKAAADSIAANFAPKSTP